ncbi:TIGR04222 domain-containing membrane protein [Streptomyces sp. CHD11]|uniref:TIGR04222 domain-containing membrane protein n=1 Tax=Streptomyces sp. CHD11 TaxID=2741325 RepID=UPI001BFCC208|nr:TIGR04222 domain-containing membrane protein [Streptomyces sp. CHD11]MBT3152196.1 TIGR04222 domain-containing membrane protein [Streptomyces sp. CHD11]
MNGSTGVRGTPYGIALLADGPRAAVTVAVVALHLRGAVEAGVSGTLRAVEGEAGRALPELPAPQTPAADFPGQAGALTDAMRAAYLESAVYHYLEEPSEVQDVVQDPTVRWALAEVRVGLAEAGMLRVPLLGRTRAARRRIQVLRKAFPVPTGRRGLPDNDILLAVALHGEAALNVLVPRFALRAGLTERVTLREKGRRGRSPRGGTYGSAGHLYCASRGEGCSGGGGCGGGGSD